MPYRKGVHDFTDRFVKFNNPLMGTEIFSFPSTLDSIIGEHVKFNNPLMGTETCYLDIFFKSSCYKALNLIIP